MRAAILSVCFLAGGRNNGCRTDCYECILTAAVAPVTALPNAPAARVPAGRLPPAPRAAGPRCLRNRTAAGRDGQQRYGFGLLHSVNRHQRSAPSWPGPTPATTGRWRPAAPASRLLLAPERRRQGGQNAPQPREMRGVRHASQHPYHVPMMNFADRLSNPRKLG